MGSKKIEVGKPKLLRLQNLNTGLVVTLSNKTATMLATNYPNAYKILDYEPLSDEQNG